MKWFNKGIYSYLVDFLCFMIIKYVILYNYYGIEIICLCRMVMSYIDENKFLFNSIYVFI